MRAHLFLIAVSWVFIMGRAEVAQAAGYPTPPCLKEENSKGRALKSLDHCLERGGWPPFREAEGSDSIEICPKEQSEYKTAVKVYRDCLKSKNAPASSGTRGGE